MSSAAFNVDDRLGMNCDRVMIWHEVPRKILVGGTSDEARNEISSSLKDAITSGKIRYNLFVLTNDGKRKSRIVESRFTNVFLLAWNCVHVNISHSMASRLLVWNFPETSMQRSGLKLAEELKKNNPHLEMDLTQCIRKYHFIQSMMKDLQKLYATHAMKMPTSTVVYAFCMALEQRLIHEGFEPTNSRWIERVNIQAHLACQEENIERVFRTRTFSKHGVDKPVGPEDMVIINRLNYVRVAHVVTALAFTYTEIIRPETSLVLKVLCDLWLTSFKCAYRKLNKQKPNFFAADKHTKSGLAKDAAVDAFMSEQGDAPRGEEPPCDLNYNYARFDKPIIDLAHIVAQHMRKPVNSDGKKNTDKVVSEEIIITILDDLTKRFCSHAGSCSHCAGSSRPTSTGRSRAPTSKASPPCPASPGTRWWPSTPTTFRTPASGVGVIWAPKNRKCTSTCNSSSRTSLPPTPCRGQGQGCHSANRASG